MSRATRVAPAGKWSGTPADTVILDFDQRHRRRMTMTGVAGTEFLLDLSDAVALRHGDGLLLEDGRTVAVAAAPEPLTEIRTETPAELLRVAWHLGNRHLPAQLAGDRIRIRRDHVIEAMVDGLGATVAHVDAPFDPEAGAYAGGGASRGHAHHHHHDGGALKHDDRLEDDEAPRG